MEIEIFREGKISLPFEDITLKSLKLYLKKICKHLCLKDVTITLIVTDNDYIRKLNCKYREKDYPTDVISFSYRETPFPNEYIKNEPLGDIYLSLEKAFMQSKEYKVSLQDEVNRLLVHGVLHLLGYDHELSKEEEKRMREKEEEILQAILSN